MLGKKHKSDFLKPIITEEKKKKKTGEGKSVNNTNIYACVYEHFCGFSCRKFKK